MRRPNALSSTIELIGIEQPLSTQFHRWWATQLAITDEDTAKLVASVERQGPAVFRRPDGSVDPFSALDAYELYLMAQRIGRTTDYGEGLRLDDNRSAKQVSD